MHINVVVGLLQIDRKHVIIWLEVQGCRLDPLIYELHAFLPDVVVDIHQIQDQPQLAVVLNHVQGVDYRGWSICLHDGPPGQKISNFSADKIMVP